MKKHQTSRRFARVTLALSALLMSATTFAALPQGPIKNRKVPADMIYHDFCSVCHGDKGDGNSRARNSFVRPPRDFTAPESKSLTRDYMFNVIKEGKPGTAMVGWKTQMTDEQINEVVTYIQTKFMGQGKDGAAAAQPSKEANPHAAAAPHADAQPPAAAPHPGGSPHGPGSSGIVAPAQGVEKMAANMSLPFNNGLKGNPSKGAAIYMANCATCHGNKGDGKGPRAYFINPKPRDFLHPVSRSAFNRPVLFEAIYNGRLGTEMPAWSKVLTDQQVADVAEFVFQNFIVSAEPAKGTANNAKK